MIPNNDTSVANISESDEDIRLALDPEAAAHLISVLTDLYSDPIEAVVREYSTNAADAHIEAGSTAPIQVTRPTRLNPVFKVRDYGVGLDIFGLRDTYALYGRSTKRESNDVNGVLGLGCKSALTYSDSFTVTAVKDGERWIASIIKDVDGVGVIKILDHSETDEPNGVEIQVPVRERDVNTFVSRINEFFSYWKTGTVLVDGEAPDNVWGRTDLIWVDDDVAIVKGGRSESVLVQHNVAYPVKYGVFTDYAVIAFVPVGSVNFTPSREALHYTARTNATIDTLKGYLTDAVPRVVQARLDAATTNYERLLILHDWRQYAPKVSQEFMSASGGHHVKRRGNIWRYNPQAYDKKAKKVGSLSWFDLCNDLPIVVGFTAQTLSEKARDRLNDQFPNRSVIVLPEGTDTTPIQGRPNVRTWQSILDATTHIKTAAGTAKTETRYTVYHQNRQHYWTAKDVQERLESTPGPVLYGPSAYGYDTFPEAFIFVIKWTQEARIQRLFPQAKETGTYRQQQQALLAKALTKDEILHLHARSFTLSWLKSHVERIIDPELQQVLRAISLKSQNINRALALGVGTPEPALLGKLSKRYALLRHDSRNFVEDAVLFVNAKYATVLSNPTTTN